MERKQRELQCGETINEIQKRFHLTNAEVCRIARMSSRSLNELKKTERRN